MKRVKKRGSRSIGIKSHCLIGIVLGESEVGTVVKIRVSLGSAWWRAKLET